MKYQIFTTQDGSPTLHWQNATDASEYMHHSGGALLESLYIYDEALNAVLTRGWPARIFSLGLGLGYNELISLARLCDKENWKIWSFEAIPLLRESFTAWASGEKNELSETYETIATLITKHFALESSEQLRTLAADALADGRLELRAAYPEAAVGMAQVSCVFYDAYSKKINPELWDEVKMLETLEPALAPNCVFTTYAALGSINRVLKTLHFKIEKKRGFAKKREATLAIRSNLGVHQ